MSKWIKALADLSRANESLVMITILNVEGSAPRDQQSKMLVTKDACF